MTPPSDVEYDSDEKYERGKDSDYDSDVRSMRTRRATAREKSSV